MPIFRYEAVDKTGKAVRGAMDAPSEQAVAQRLAAMGYRPQNIVLPGSQASQQPSTAVRQRSDSDRPKRKSAGTPVSVETSASLRDLAFFYRQLAAYIRSGMTPYQALADLQGMSRSGKIRKAVARMAERVKAGDTLSSAMAEFPGVFPVHATALIWNGELGGYLENSIDEVATAMEEEVKDNRYARFGWIIFKINLISFILTIPAVNLNSLLLNGVEALGTDPKSKIPNLDNPGAAVDPGQVLSSGVDPMKMAAAVLKGYVHTVAHTYLPIIVACLIFWVLWARLKRVPDVKRVFDAVILGIPLWGSIQRERGRARFARSLASLHKGGIDPATAWDAASLTVRNSVMVDQLRACSPMLRQSGTLQEAVARSGIYGHEAAGMIGTGEKTGQVSDMAERLAAFHESNVAGLKAQARTWAISALVVMMTIMIGYTVIQSVRTYFMLETETLPKMLGIPGL